MNGVRGPAIDPSLQKSGVARKQLHDLFRYRFSAAPNRLRLVEFETDVIAGYRKKAPDLGQWEGRCWMVDLRCVPGLCWKNLEALAKTSEVPCYPSHYWANQLTFAELTQQKRAIDVPCRSPGVCIELLRRELLNPAYAALTRMHQRYRCYPTPFPQGRKHRPPIIEADLMSPGSEDPHMGQ